LIVKPELMDADNLDANLRQAMRVFSRASDRGEFRHYPGITVISSGFDYCAFNPALLTAEVESELEFSRRLAIPETHYQERGLHWSLWIREDLLQGRIRSTSRLLLERRGYRLLIEPPGMATYGLSPPVRSLPLVECRQVREEADRYGFAHILSVCFEIASPVARAIYGSQSYWSEGITGWLGYVNGNPVTAALVVEAENSIGLYSVATLPGHQRRGYCEALVRHALEECRRRTGIEFMVLQATRQGYSLYERMGFRTLTRYRVYLAP
jgi:ribosomal protein S18 acetylase RimI-like enzyme